MENEFQEIDLQEIIHILKTRWWIICICFIVSVTTTGIVSFYMLEPVYRAETSLFLGKESNKIGGIDLGELQLSNQLVNDYREIIKSRSASKEVIDELGLDVDIRDFQNQVDVTTIKDSRLFKIAFESTDPEFAADVANAFADVIINKATEIVEVKNIQVIDVAEVPEFPIKPNKKMNVAIAGVLGLILGAFVVFVLEYLDHTIKNEKDIERHLGLSIIGEIPKFEGHVRNTGNKVEQLKGKMRRKRKADEQGEGNISASLITILDPKAPASEAYRSLRTNIGYTSIDRQIKTIVLTSPGPAEGKSTTIANLAISLTQAGKRVLLIDADLRKPKLHKYFGVSNGAGVTEIIVNNKPLASVVKMVMDRENLYLMTSGSVPPNPSEILESKKMLVLLNSLKEEFDMILIDTPPVGQLTDAAILGKNADGVLLVNASGQTNIDIAKHAKLSLENVKAKLLGVILTKIEKSASGYYYYKYYNYDNYYYKD